MKDKITVELFGSSGRTTVTLPAPSGEGSIPIPPENTNLHTRAVFACLRDLGPRLDDAGISEADYLTMVRSEFSVASLSELSESMWARLSATLNACDREPELFNRLVAKVKAHAAKQTPQTPLTDAMPVIFAEPEDTSDTCFVIRRDRSTGSEKIIFIGDVSDEVHQRCQAHADKTRCIVFLYYAGQKPQPFYPTQACSPV